ncbi:hypothetical protein CALCODRAFT_510865 [Calocera cornea HHB12733]|uniref:DUF6532 domain-containing protein n=1 Tax=Calocera cornea HHB12733 TaxID=1353952 RepID=A0A165E8F9_9BASI|nr:hypothetical protein CALCODRAFT_510865 [Calocera cornea HHB12733]
MAFRNATPPINATLPAWEQWQELTERLPPVVKEGLLRPRGILEFEERRAAWIKHTSTIYSWDARRAGEWDFVLGGIYALLKEYKAVELHDDMQSQERGYWAICDIAELLQNFHLENGRYLLVNELVSRHIKHPDTYEKVIRGDREDTPELDVRDDLSWESVGDPDASLVDEIFRAREFKIPSEDGTSETCQVLAPRWAITSSIQSSSPLERVTEIAPAASGIRWYFGRRMIDLLPSAEVLSGIAQYNCSVPRALVIPILSRTLTSMAQPGGGFPPWLLQLDVGRYGIAYDFRTHSLLDPLPQGWNMGNTRNFYRAMIRFMRGGGLWKAQYSMYMGYAHPTWFYAILRGMRYVSPAGSFTSCVLKVQIYAVPMPQMILTDTFRLGASSAEVQPQWNQIRTIAAYNRGWTSTDDLYQRRNGYQVSLCMDTDQGYLAPSTSIVQFWSLEELQKASLNSSSPALTGSATSPTVKATATVPTMAQPARTALGSKNAQQYFSEQISASTKSEKKTTATTTPVRVKQEKPASKSAIGVKGVSHVTRTASGRLVMTFELEDSDDEEPVKPKKDLFASASVEQSGSRSRGGTKLSTGPQDRSSKTTSKPRVHVDSDEGDDDYEPDEDPDEEEDEEEDELETETSRRAKRHRDSSVSAASVTAKRRKSNNAAQSPGYSTDAGATTKAKLADYSPDYQKLIQDAKAIYRIQYYTVNLYPSAAQIEEYLETAVAIANNKAAMREDELKKRHKVPKIARLDLDAEPAITSMGTWSRSRLKTAAQAVVKEAYYQWLGPGVSEELRAQAIKTLLGGYAFVYSEPTFDGNVLVKKKGPFRHPALKMLYDATFLGNPGTIAGAAWDHPELFAADRWPLGLVAALACAYMSGSVKPDTSVTFRSSRYQKEYETLMINLRAYKKESRPECTEMLQMLLQRPEEEPEVKTEDAQEEEEDRIFMKFDGSEEL